MEENNTKPPQITPPPQITKPPQITEVPDVVTHTVPGLEPTKKPTSILSILLPLLILGVILAGGVYIWTLLMPTVRPTDRETSEIAPTPTPEIVTRSASTSWVYVKDGNVFLFSQAQGRQQPLTTDAVEPKIWYRHPKFVNKDKVSYVKCQRIVGKGETEKDPYTCTLTLHDLTTNQTTDVFSLSSVQNTANYAIGGYITAYDWKPTADEFVALADEAEPDGSNTKLKLHHYQVATKTDTILFEHPPTPGRGGSLDDQTAVRYSPDYSKVVLVATGMLPSFTGKPSTLMVFDTATPKEEPIWSSEPGKWATFGTWLTKDKLAAKTGSSTGSGYSLVTIDPASPSATVSNNDVDDWYAITAIDSDKVVYYTERAKGQSGINLVFHNLTDDESSLLESNLFPVKYLGKNMLAVRTSRNCASDPDGGCGMDFYNGIQQSGFGVLNLETKYTETIPIPKGDSEIYDFDVISL